jgi:murein DD-endopeptidase MepM/ murein hydrolase activator NlpD
MIKNFILAVVMLFLFGNQQPMFVSATRVEELRAQIDEYNSQIAELEKEIAEYQKQIDSAGKESKTLKNQILQLEIRIKKFRADITLTGKQISAADILLEEITLSIRAKEKEIGKTKQLLAEVIRNMDEIESRTLIEVLLAHNSLSDFFGDLERMKDFQNNINVNLGQLKSLKNDFQKQEDEKNAEKEQLENLKLKLADQKFLVEDQKIQKNVLLKETQNKESAYKKLLNDRTVKQKALGEEIHAIEEEIRIIIDPASLPPIGTGVLKWPLDEIKITQEFGWTSYARSHSWLYPKEVGHNGVDFKASIGTPIKAAMNGTAVVGDTDIGCSGVSYGKWVLIKHPNNLSTLYAHLSLIKVLNGEEVQTGQIIGRSGDTGISDGPHLHFGVIATQGIIGYEYKSKVCGRTMRLPLVAPNGYLNPLSYL